MHNHLTISLPSYSRQASNTDYTPLAGNFGEPTPQPFSAVDEEDRPQVFDGNAAAANLRATQLRETEERRALAQSTAMDAQLRNQASFAQTVKDNEEAIIREAKERQRREEEDMRLAVSLQGKWKCVDWYSL